MMDETTNKSQMVRDLMLKVLYKPEEVPDGKPPEDSVIVDGIMGKYAFHPDRIAAAKEKIRWLLDEMPDEFHKGKGGGWSFLNLCMDKHGTHWAEHPTMNDLICLGIGAGMAKWATGREFWNAMPGGMPYVIFDTGERDLK